MSSWSGDEGPESVANDLPNNWIVEVVVDLSKQLVILRVVSEVAEGHSLVGILSETIEDILVL